jgi:hypothetical protein
MKRLVLMVVCALSFCVAKAQDIPAYDYAVDGNELKLTKIIEATGLSTQEAHDRVELHLASVFNDANHTCKMNTTSELVYKGIFDVAVMNLGIVYCTPFELRVSLKDDRARVIIAITDVVVEGGTFSYNITDAHPLGDKYVGLTKKQTQKVFDGALSQMQSMIDGIAECITSTPDDDW